MHKKNVKYYIPVFLISLVIVLSSTFILGNIIEPKEYVNDMNFFIESEGLFATTETNTSSAVNSNFTNDKIKGSTVWPIVAVYKYKDKNKSSYNGTLAALTECLVIDSYLENEVFQVKYVTNGKSWQDSSATFETCWVNSRRVLINLPDICDDIQYDITNAYSSKFKIGSSSKGSVVNIDGLTKQQLYTYDNYDGKVDGKVYNPKLGREEFVCPLIFPFAEEVATAQKNAKTHGYVLKIYDAYRPQEDVCNKFWSLTQKAMNASTAAYNLINKNGWGLGWFVANPNNGGSSDHARGTAIDVTLVKDGKEINTPSDMHDLSTNSVKTTSPTTNYNVEPDASHRTEGTKLLHEIMVKESGMGGLPSEWWHYNTARTNTEFSTHVGYKNITYTDKTELKITKTEISPENTTIANERTVTLTTNKDIASAKGSKSGNWQVTGKTAKYCYKSNVTSDVVTITDKNGNTAKKTINISNIDNSVSISSKTSTNNPSITPAQKVKVTITANEPLEKVTESSVNWTISGNIATATYTQNKTETVKIWDKYGNSESIPVNVSNVDTKKPTILETKYYNASKLNQEWVLITADEPIEVADSGKAFTYEEEPTSTQINYFESGKNVDSSYRIIFMYDNNYNSDTIKIKDLAGNIESTTLKIDGIDEDGPVLTVTYTTDGKTYTDSKYSTNKDVQVTIKADEPIANLNGWDLSSDNKTLTKTYSASNYPSGKKETIEVRDKNGNVTNASIKVNIDTVAPYVVSPKTEITSSTGNIGVTVTLNEICTIVSGEGWEKSPSGNPVAIYKNYTGATSEDGEIVTITDDAGNEYSFGVRVKEDNGKLTAKVFDTVAPILEEIIYGSTKLTNSNVRVTLVINEKVNEVDGWDLQEGTGDYENKWILTKLYTANVEEDYIEIKDVDGNKVVGNNTTKKYVTEEGKVKISVTNIDKVAPTVQLKNFENTSGGIKVTVEANEKIKIASNDNWKIVDSSTSKEISGTIAKGETEILKVQDEAGNVTWIKIAANAAGDNVTVTEGAIVEDITYSPSKKKSSKVNVSITINKGIGKVNNKSIALGETVDGWKLSEGVGNNSGKGIITKEYTENGDYEVQIEDAEGNKVIGEDIVDGKVKVTVVNVEENYVEKEVSSIEIASAPTKTIYYIGDKLNLDGLSIKVNYADGTEETVDYEGNNDNGIEVAKYGSSNKSNIIMLTQVGPKQQIVVYYGDKTAWFYVTVNELQITGIKVKTNPTKTKYKIGETLNTEGLVLEATYNNGSTRNITTGFTVEKTTLETVGQRVIEVEYEGKTTTFTVSVSLETEKTIRRIEIKQWPNKNIEYIEGQNINTEGLILTVVYSDGTTEDITEGFTVEPTLLESVGMQNVIIKYGGKIAEDEVIVNRKEVTELKLIKNPDKTNYNKGVSVDLTGIKLEATYNNGKKETIENLDEISCIPEVLTEAGTQEVTVFCKGHEEKSVKFEVIVNDLAIDKIEVVLNSSKTYYKGDKININLIELLVTFNDGTTDTITRGFTVSPEVLADAGTQTVKVEYEGKTATFDIDVKDASVQNIKIKSLPDKKTFVVDEILNASEDLFGLVVEAEYSDGSKQEIELNELEIEDITFSKKGTQAIKIVYRGKEASFDVNVRNMKFQIIGIKQGPEKTEYNKGDKLDITGLELYVNNEYSEIITIDASLYDEITYSPMELNEIGTQKVIVKHDDDGDDITFNVTVKETQNQQNTDDSNQQEEDDSNQKNDEKSEDKSKDNNSDDSQKNDEKSNDESKDNNSDDSQKSDEKNNSNSKQNDDNVTDKSTNGDSNSAKDNTTAPNSYKDANTANSRLPQTGITQIIIVILIVCAVVSGVLFIKYRKI